MMARLRLLILSAALAAAPFPARAGDAEIQVVQAWARRAAMVESGDPTAGRGNGAVYATLVNRGKESDALIGAASDVATAVEIHESYRDMGMTMMRPVDRVDVVAGQKLEMKPGGYHFMLLNLRRGLETGQVVRLTLQFRRAGEIDVSAEVR